MTKILIGTLSVLESLSGAFVLYGLDTETGERVPLGTVDDRVPEGELRKRGGKYDPNQDFLLLDDYDFEIVRS